MPDCPVCSKNIDASTEALQCTSCQLSCHLKCSGIKNRSSRNAWLCESCKNSSNSATNKDELNILIAEVRTLANTVKGITAEFKDFKEALNAFSSFVDSFKDTVADLNKTVLNLEKKNNVLETENAKLKSDFAEMDRRVLFLEQRSRIQNIEVCGVPEVKGENCENIIHQLASAAGIQPRDGDIQVAHRVKTFSGKHPYPIVCQLGSRATAVRWLAAFKRTRNLMATDISRDLPEQKIFISEQLVPRIKKLLLDTKKKTKEIGYKYVWSKEGRIFVRRAEGEAAMEIHDHGDLTKLSRRRGDGNTN